MAPSRPSSALDTAALFRRVLELRMSFLAVLDERGTVVEINNAPLRLGLTREQFVGRHIAETPSFAGDPEWRRTWNSRLSEVAVSGLPMSYEDCFAAPDGSVRSANATLTPVHGADAGPHDPPQQFLLEADDTTEQLQVELALRASERHFHDMTESLPVMCWTCDAEGVTDYVNARWTDYTGLAAEQLKGWGWTDTIHSDDRAQLASLVGPSLAAGEPFSTEYRVRDHDGDYRWFEMKMVPVRDAEGRLVRWYGAAVDVHEAHELRSTLARRDAKLDAALGAGGIIRFTADLDAGAFTADPGLAELLGVPDLDSRGPLGLQGFLVIVHELDLDRYRAAVSRALDPTGDGSYAVAHRLSADESRWVETRGTFTFDAAGKPRSLSGVVFPRTAAPDG